MTSSNWWSKEREHFQSMSWQALLRAAAQVTAQSWPLSALLKWQLLSTLPPLKCWTCCLVSSRLSSTFSSFLLASRWCNILFIHVWSPNKVNGSSRKKNWLPLSSSRAYSSIPYPFSYQVGVVWLAFWESPESLCVEDEKHLVLSVWHPGEEMNLCLWRG